MTDLLSHTLQISGAACFNIFQKSANWANPARADIVDLRDRLMVSILAIIWYKSVWCITSPLEIV